MRDMYGLAEAPEEEAARCLTHGGRLPMWDVLDPREGPRREILRGSYERYAAARQHADALGLSSKALRSRCEFCEQDA